MPEVLTPQIILFFLVFARIGSVMMLLPALGDQAIPAQVRLAVALLVSIVVLPTVMLALPVTPKSFPGFASLLIGELLIGLMLGAAVRLFMNALQIAGTIIGMQSGLAIAMAFDPSQGGQIAIQARFLSMTALLLIFVTDLHHLMLAGIVRSYSAFPPGAPAMAGDFGQMAIYLVGQSFALGVQLAAPFLLYGVLFNVGLGVLARLVPTMQVFFIAQPLSILLSFLLWFMVLGMMMQVFLTRFADTFNAIFGRL